MSEQITKERCCGMMWAAPVLVVVTVLGAAVLLGGGLSRAADSDESAGAFSTPTIDLGVVVSDIEESAKFYTEAIGFQELERFTVSAEVAGGAGLTDDEQLDIRVFTLGDGPGATKVKLMQLSNAPGEAPNQEFIHSTYGFSYLTLHINDTNAALERLEQAGAESLADGPVALPETDIYLTLVKDPDGNFIELLGPKK